MKQLDPKELKKLLDEAVAARVKEFKTLSINKKKDDSKLYELGYLHGWCKLESILKQRGYLKE